MPTNDIDIVTAPSRLPSTQATAIEQARAVAEVQAAVVVAQQVPRDMGAAEADMREACTKIGMAQRAFYSVVNRGAGPSVHLARELARIFGNVQYGVHELRRDDVLGMSEIQAFAWDVEKNVRSTRTFQVPHQRMKGGKRQPLTDLTDVYLNNQNIGARAVRECIFTVLPAWLTDQAVELCNQTLVNGEGKPLADRVEDMVRAFAGIGVTVDQLEDKIGRKRSAWQPVDVAQMLIVFQSIGRGEITKDDAFPIKRITADEILSDDQKPATTAPAAPQPAPVPQRGSTDDGPDDAPPPGGPLSAESSPDTQQPPAGRLSGDRPAAATEPGPAATDDSSSGEAAEPEVTVGRVTGPRCTVPQQAELAGQLSRLDVEDHDERLWWLNHLAGLPEGTVDHPKQLKAAEAVKVLRTLESMTSRDELDASLSQGSLLGDE